MSTSIKAPATWTKAPLDDPSALRGAITRRDPDEGHFPPESDKGYVAQKPVSVGRSTDLGSGSIRLRAPAKTPHSPSETKSARLRPSAGSTSSPARSRKKSASVYMPFQDGVSVPIQPSPRDRAGMLTITKPNSPESSSPVAVPLLPSNSIPTLQPDANPYANPAETLLRLPPQSVVPYPDMQRRERRPRLRLQLPPQVPSSPSTPVPIAPGPWSQQLLLPLQRPTVPPTPLSLLSRRYQSLLPSSLPSDLNSDAPAPFPPSLSPSNTNTNAPPAPTARTIYDDRSFEPFSRSSPLCLDGLISDQSKYVVASGGYADVWTGLLGNKQVAIKVMRPFSGSGSHIEISKLIKRSWREYLAWSRLYHPNILRCLGFSYDFSPQTGQPSLVSPWMSNGIAINYIKERPNIDRLEIVVGIARGLTYLHNLNPTIVHGDLRAGNVLISDSGVACLSDFGLSKILSDVRGMTTSSELAGSLRWMAPELLRGDSLNMESDVWAYGMTVLEILTGKRPYSDITFDLLILEQISKGVLPTRPNDIPLITDDIWTLCQQCWHSLPSERPSMNDVLAEIESVGKKVKKLT